MMMPIVSMNKMAMNESVAATCCFRQVATPLQVYWEVLSGGWIGSGYVQELQFRAGYTSLSDSNAWLGSNWGYDLTGDAANLVKFMTENTLVYGAVNPTAKPQFWVNQVGGTTGFESLEAMIKAIDPTLGIGDKCDHKNGNCKYKTFVQAYKSNQHFESKTAHKAGGDNWADPHNSTQFSS